MEIRIETRFGGINHRGAGGGWCVFFFFPLRFFPFSLAPRRVQWRSSKAVSIYMGPLCCCWLASKFPSRKITADSQLAPVGDEAGCVARDVAWRHRKTRRRFVAATEESTNAQEQHRTHSGQLACGEPGPLLHKEGLTIQQQQQWSGRPRGPKNPLIAGTAIDRFV